MNEPQGVTLFSPLNLAPAASQVFTAERPALGALCAGVVLLRMVAALSLLAHVN